MKEKISITIDSDLLEHAKKEAEADDRSLSQFINLILKKHLAEKKSKKKHKSMSETVKIAGPKAYTGCRRSGQTVCGEGLLSKSRMSS